MIGLVRDCADAIKKAVTIAALYLLEELGEKRKHYDVYKRHQGNYFNPIILIFTTKDD